MQVFDDLCSFDPRYRPLLIEIGLDPQGNIEMLRELTNAPFVLRQAIIEHQLSWLQGIYNEMRPVKRIIKPRHLTGGRYRGKL